MNALKRFSTSLLIVSLTLISAESGFAGPPDNASGRASIWSSGTGLLRKPVAVASPAPTIQSGVPVTVRDHRTPGGSRQSSGGPPPAAPPGTVPTIPSTKAIGSPVRDHRPGGNADPCLKPNNTCSANSRSASIVEFRKKHPNFTGLDGDPCFQTRSCNESQLIESLIARHERNLQIGWCDSRIKGEGCAQKFILPDGKGGQMMLTLHFEGNKGKLLEKDRQYLLGQLQTALEKSRGGGEAAKTRVTDHRNASKDRRATDRRK